MRFGPSFQDSNFLIQCDPGLRRSKGRSGFDLGCHSSPLRGAELSHRLSSELARLQWSKAPLGHYSPSPARTHWKVCYTQVLLKVTFRLLQ